MIEERQFPVATARHIQALLQPKAGSYSPLVWLLAEDAEDASFAAERLAVQSKTEVVSVGKVLAPMLAPLTALQRRQRARALLEDAVRPTGDRAVVLDHIEVLFHPSLSINVGVQMEVLSRQCRALLVVWPGTVAGLDLHYGKPGHPEEQKHPLGARTAARLDADLQIISAPT